MKKKSLIIVAIIAIISIISTVVLVSNSNNKKETNSGEKKDEMETLTQSGTGEIKLKDFIESPKVVNKSWTEATINELKTIYNVNENKQHSTIPLAGNEELWIYFSGKNDGTTTTKTNGVEITTYDENVTVKDLFGTSIRVSSVDLKVDEIAPETLKTDSITYTMQTDAPDLTEERKQEIMDRTGYFYPFMENNKCYTLVDVLNALGMKETDKTIYEAIQKSTEYDAVYNSEFGKVNLTYYPNDNTGEIYLIFKDENAVYDSVQIVEGNEKTGEGTYSQIEVRIYKK